MRSRYVPGTFLACSCSPGKRRRYIVLEHDIERQGSGGLGQGEQNLLAVGASMPVHIAQHELTNLFDRRSGEWHRYHYGRGILAVP